MSWGSPDHRTRIVLAHSRAESMREDLEAEGLEVFAAVSPADLVEAAADAALGSDATRIWAALAEADAVVLEASRDTVTPAVVAACDRLGVRILPLVDGPAAEHLARSFGLGESLPPDAEAWRVARALAAASVPTPPTAGAPRPARVIAVWGPHGAPGRSTVAVELAVELARGGRHVGLVDADTHAPSLALALGLADEGPGFAAACRQAELGGLDARELTRISAPLPHAEGRVDVLTGLNRPSRWPELSDRRVRAALAVCREWADYVVVDVASALERDEEIVSDLDGPRRNAATLAVLGSADLVVAVASADPLGVSRFLRGYGELRATVGVTPVAVVANRLRPGALGIDARGQVRRTLERFAGITDVTFLPLDARAADAAMLSARPIADAAPRSPLTLAVRRLAGELVGPAAAPSGARVARRRRREPHSEEALRTA
ncbi:MAG TPA: P-loop NTPase [Microbacterium sp.]|uniref:AAA family ATPase n=1 Tax=Microbacterium sp. TaxID=51671 RepID=UPI002D1506C6|nr:P-loop NTPase [Microbacterium sp.]HWI31320.1 P-loop NTPase [Microbacterium sp.]